MPTDNYFTIGTSHIKEGTPCEDYALSGELRPGLSFGVVSDGCSGVDGHTDVGARAISFAFRRALGYARGQKCNWFSGSFTKHLTEFFLSNSFTDDYQDGFATVVGFAATPEHASVYIYGDGAYALRYADGHYRLVTFEWAGNAPYYLNYTVNPAADAIYAAEIIEGQPGPLIETTLDFRLTGIPDYEIQIINKYERHLSIDEVKNGIVHTLNPQESGVQALAVLTDGISKIGRITSHAAVAELFAYKNHQGSFVKRRMMRALDVYAAKGHRPQDDLAMACVWFGEE